MEKFLYPNHPVRCIVTGLSECGKSYFLTTLVLKMNKGNEKLFIYSTSLHQDFYQKIIKCFTNYILRNIISKILSSGDVDSVIEHIGKAEDFEKTDTGIETIESIDELKYPQIYDDWGKNLLDELNENELMN